jgi:nitrite reductase/ring-hydroxylating ferredoxin subunit
VLVKVAELEQLPEGGNLVTRIEGREIILIRRRGEVYALRNICPHQSQSFEKGITRARIIADRTTRHYVADRGAPVLICPWHGWEFDLQTGQCVIDAEYRTRSYRVSVDDGGIYLEMERKPRGNRVEADAELSPK